MRLKFPSSASPLPLPLGEVAERSEDGEGIPGCDTLSVTFGDSSPKGRAKWLCEYVQRCFFRLCKPDKLWYDIHTYKNNEVLS